MNSCVDPPLVDGAKPIHVSACHRFDTCYQQQVSICCVVIVSLDQTESKNHSNCALSLQSFCSKSGG